MGLPGGHLGGEEVRRPAHRLVHLARPAPRREAEVTDFLSTVLRNTSQTLPLPGLDLLVSGLLS